MGNNRINLGIRGAAAPAPAELGPDLDTLLAAEVEPGLGNGGLGRPAARCIDSMATLGLPAPGYGMRCEHGIVQQEIADGWQVEKTDRRLRTHNPRELMRPEWAVDEQIATPGKQAAGTGNMKFMLHGALTVGTLDGANLEIRDAAGPESFFLFGVTAKEVEALRAAGCRPLDRVVRNPRRRALLDGLMTSTAQREPETGGAEKLLTRADGRGSVLQQEPVTAGRPGPHVAADRTIVRVDGRRGQR